MSNKTIDVRHFRIALASAGISQNEFARMQNVAHATMSKVLRGETKSKRLSEAISSLIDTEFKKMNLKFSNEAA